MFERKELKRYDQKLKQVYMGKLIQFPGTEARSEEEAPPTTLIRPGLLLPQVQPLIESSVPKEFRRGFAHLLRGNSGLDTRNNGLKEFFCEVIDWVATSLKLTLTREQKIWFAGKLVQFREAIGQNEDTIAELIEQAARSHSSAERALKFEQAGDKSVMAAGGFVATRRPDLMRPSYYVGQASAAYESAASIGRHPVLLGIAYGQKVPDLALIARVVRILASGESLEPMYDFINQHTTPQTKPKPDLKLV